MEGLKVTDIEKQKELYDDPQKVSKILVELFSEMIFHSGHVHCDAHPGNIMVR